MIPENNHKALDMAICTIAVPPFDDIDENDSPEESDGTGQQALVNGTSTESEATNHSSRIRFRACE